MNNPMQALMQMMRNGGDPRQILINMLSSQQNLNPIGRNLLDMAERNDLSGATNVTQNIANENGMNSAEIQKQIASLLTNFRR